MEAHNQSSKDEGDENYEVVGPLDNATDAPPEAESGEPFADQPRTITAPPVDPVPLRDDNIDLNETRKGSKSNKNEHKKNVMKSSTNEELNEKVQKKSRCKCLLIVGILVILICIAILAVVALHRFTKINFIPGLQPVSDTDHK